MMQRDRTENQRSLFLVNTRENQRQIFRDERDPQRFCQLKYLRYNASTSLMRQL